MSSGGKLQLAFRGPQDVYLSGQPQKTFFKALYKRYTNFAKECIWVPFDGNPQQGGKSTAIIDRQGDLIQEAFITADVSIIDGDTIDGSGGGAVSSNSLAYAAERLIESVELYIGQQQIDIHYQRWWRLYSELYHDDAKKDQYSKLTSPDSVSVTTNNRIYLPLIFFFNRNPGLALPLISIPNQQVRLVFNWNNTENFWTGLNITPQVIPTSIKCWVNYIYLDKEERSFLGTKPQTYLIDQVQFSGQEPIPARSAVTTTPYIVSTGPTHRVPLNFKHPIKELIWCFPLQDQAEQKQYNFSTASMGLTEVIAAGTDDTEPHLSGGVVRLRAARHFGESEFGPLQSLFIELNKSKVVEEQEGKYFNSMQPFQCHSGCPTPGIYNYSFALQPESIKPTGSCNFSRIDDAACFLRLKDIANTTGDNLIMEIYAVNFNVLDIKKGFASLAFSS